MKTKTIPFDLETAKKIQAGEIEGKIISNNAAAEILAFDVYYSYQRLVVAKTKNNTGTYGVRLYTEFGKDFESDNFYDLRLEVPDNEPQEPKFDSPYIIEQLDKLKKYTEQLMEVNQSVIDNLNSMIQELKKACNSSLKNEFKQFDRVLVRNDINSIWRTSIFTYQIGDSFYTVSRYPYKKENIIPYEGNEHLIGTTNNPK